MAPSDLAKVGPWGPAVFSICRELGPSAAVVFAAVRNYSRRSRKVCDASTGSMAELLGMNRETVNRALIALREAGYLTDLTPKLQRRPHSYVDSGHAEQVYLLRRTVHTVRERVETTETTEVVLYPRRRRRS